MLPTLRVDPDPLEAFLRFVQLVVTAAAVLVVAFWRLPNGGHFGSPDVRLGVANRVEQLQSNVGIGSPFSTATRFFSERNASDAGQSKKCGTNRQSPSTRS
jgi:hypothetical protein